MKWKQATFTVLTIALLILSVSSAFASVTIPKRPIFFPFNNGAYLTFSTSILPLTFSSVYRDTVNRWHFGNVWLTSTADVTITAWFSSDWLNYTVPSSGTQQISNGSKPTAVYFDGVFTAEGDGWTYTGTIITVVTEATSSVGLNWGNNPPAIGETSAPSTVYANKYELLNVTINDVDGVANFENCTAQLNSSIQLQWIRTTDTFSEAADASNYATLDASNCVKTTVNSTALTLSWKVKFGWNFTEGAIFVNGTVYDGDTSATASSTQLFTFEDDLIISSVTHLPGQPAAGQQIFLTGQIYYEGTVTAPEDATGITVYAVRNNTATQVGSTSTFTAGAFSMSWQEGTDGTYGYDVYCVTDEASTQNRTEIIYVEKIISGGHLPYDIIIPNIPNQDNTDNSGSSDLGPGWVLPVGFNVAAGILVFSCLVGIVCYDAYEKDFKLSGIRKSWSKRKRNKKTEWKKKEPWD